MSCDSGREVGPRFSHDQVPWGSGLRAIRIGFPHDLQQKPWVHRGFCLKKNWSVTWCNSDMVYTPKTRHGETREKFLDLDG